MNQNKCPAHWDHTFHVDPHPHDLIPMLCELSNKRSKLHSFSLSAQSQRLCLFKFHKPYAFICLSILL